MADIISEKIIEDILSSDKSILAETLGVNSSGLSLIARQRRVASGELDLLYLYDSDLLLIELKVVPFYDGVVTQINNYYNDLIELQRHRKLIEANIQKIVLVTGYTTEHAIKCAREKIQLLAYQPEYILSRYYENFRELSYFLNIQSGDYGVVRLGLIKPTLKLLATGKSLREIAELEIKSPKTVANRLAVAAQLNLVTKHKNAYFLTDFGNTLVEIEATLDDRLSDEEVQLLSAFVTENPFYSSVTYTILTMVESIFVLAKSIYPVPSEVAQDYFVKSVGKTQTWRADKARETAAYIYSNYACELQFLAKVHDHFYITARGIQSILILQLNRSIKLIEAQR